MRGVFVPETECALLKDSLKRLQEQIGRVPRELLKGNDSPPITEVKRFDPNRFFEVFDKVTPNDGYVLDYVYLHFFGVAGWGYPLLYTRKADSEPLPSAEEYRRAFAGEESHPLLWIKDVSSKNENHPSHRNLTLEKSVSGFFQFAVFCEVIDMFYLYQHCVPRMKNSIFTYDDIGEALRRSLGTTVDDPHRLEDLDPRPRVTMDGDSAEVVFVLYSPWCGFYYQYSHITWPNLLNKVEGEIITTCSCSIRF